MYKKDPHNNSIQTNCTIRDQYGNPYDNPFNYKIDKYKGKGVIFSPTVVHWNQTKTTFSYLTILYTTDRSVRGLTVSWEGGRGSVTYGVCTKCQPPEFVNQIPDPLMRQLEGIVDYSVAGQSGHMLWFNINRQPMYCFTPEADNLSAQV